MIAGRRTGFLGRGGDGGTAPSEPEIVLPVQPFDPVRHGPTMQPERMLMIAILGDAIRSCRRLAWACNPEDREELADVRDWVQSTDPSWLYSFENICDTLGLDSRYLRKGFHRWLEDSRMTRRRGQRPRRPPSDARHPSAH